MMMKVAIPQFGDSVAPRFEAANNLVIATIDGKEVISSVNIPCAGPEGYRRIRLLQIHRVEVLICNGIKASYLDMLSASRMTVYPKVSMTVADALAQLIDGNLISEGKRLNEPAQSCTLSHDELIDSAQRIFERNGYSVAPGPGHDAFLIDLVAEISCPVCDRLVRVAICCGAHTYRPDLEIAEFCWAASSGYNARVFVCPFQPAISNSCREYGIQLIDPDPETQSDAQKTDSKIPLLSGLVTDHERACCTEYGE